MRIICNLILLLILGIISLNAAAEDRYLFAEKIEYNDSEGYVEAIGNVRIASGEYVIKADRILYDTTKDEVWSYGNISAIDNKSHIALGNAAMIKKKAKEIIISSFILYFKESDAIIASKLAIRKNKDLAKLENAAYTACKACSKHRPMWQIYAKKADLYLDQKKAIYKHMLFKIYGLPILYFPYFSHPLPGAPPKSGILIPNVKHKKPGIPFYFRPKSNFDITLTPRIASSGGLFEAEIRHLINRGSYKITSLMSTKKENITTARGNQILSQKKIRRYQISGNGHFQKNRLHYGFNIARVSDRDFLRKYSSLNMPHLATDIYAYRVDKSNFWKISNVALQDLSPEYQPSKDPIITPEISFRYVKHLPESSAKIQIENYSSNFSTDNAGRVSRSIWELKFNNSLITKSGQVLGMELYNRSDLYNVNLESIPNNKKASFARNIPEARFSVRYPLISQTAKNSLIIEPIAMLAIGQKNLKTSNKIMMIDSKKHDFDDINFLKFNRFHGYDFHETGSRIAYGSKAILQNSTGIKAGLFAGQLQNLNKKAKQKPDIVGRLYFNIKDQLELYYRFKKKPNKLSAVFDEVGLWVNRGKVTFDGGYISMDKNESLSRQKVKQIYLDTNYNYNQYWSFGYNSRIDLSASSPKELMRGMRVTYKGDCVNISSSFTRDYTSDGKRGIRKTRDYSFAIGLRTLNM